jgi:dihydrofolate reductase
MKISIIVAMDKNCLIGLNNKIPWKLSADLKRFKEITTGYPIIMGRKTFDSIGRALPNRINIVVSKNVDLNIKDVIIKNSLEAAIDFAKTTNLETCYIIGGSIIYSEALEKNYVDEILLTDVITSVKYGENDYPVFFPDIDKNNWDMDKFPDFYEIDDKNEHNMMFINFKRKTI